jgi:hypothetical protein
VLGEQGDSIMKLNLGARTIAAAVIGAAFAAGAAFADTSDFVGNWINNDAGTSDLTRIVVMPAGPNHVKVRAFGECQPTDCDWGVVPGRGYADSVASHDVRIVTAEFNPGFKKSLLILRIGPGGNLRYQLLTDFTDGSGRTDYETGGSMHKVSFFPPLPPHPIIPPPGPQPQPFPPHPMPMPHPFPALMGPEDCIGFNPSTVTVAHVGGAWKVVSGSMWMLDFGPDKASADRAASVIIGENFNRQCFVKRPHAEMTYWKSGNQVPSSQMPGQDCVHNNPATTSVQNVGGDWKVVDGSHWMLDYGGDQASANQALAVIRHYHLNRQCFIKRPNAEMTYWLAE